MRIPIPVPPTLVWRQIISAFMAILIAQLVGLFFPLLQEFWVALTAIVVSLTITSSSSAFRRSIQRVGGTLIGIAVGTIFVQFFIHTHIFPILLIVTSTLAYWSKCFTRHYTIFVCLISIVVAMLLAVLFQKEHHLLTELLYYRFIDTLIGAIIAYLTALLIMPHHHNIILTLLIDILQQVSHLNRISLQAASKEEPPTSPDFFHCFNFLEKYINEEIPTWSYELLFNRYIYCRFKLFMHRLSKILFTLDLLYSLTPGLQFDSQHPFYKALVKNADIVQYIIEALVHKRLDLAHQHLNTLHHINHSIQHLAIAYPSDKKDKMQQISAILYTLEEDFIALIHGVSLTFLFKKADKDSHVYLMKQFYQAKKRIGNMKP